MGNDGVVAVLLCQSDCLQSLGDASDLVELDEYRVCASQLDALSKALRIRHEQVISDDLDLVSQLLRHQLPAVPVFFVHSVLDGCDRILIAELLPILHELSRCKCPSGLRHLVDALLICLPAAGCRIYGDDEIGPRLIPGVLDGGDHVVQHLELIFQVRSISALISHCRGVSFLFQILSQLVIHLCAPSEGFLERRRSYRHDHELLDIDGVRCMLSAVQDVHHRHRKRRSVDPAEESVKRDTERCSSGLRTSQRNCQNGVRSEAALVFRAVQRHHLSLDTEDVRCVLSDEQVSYLVIDKRNCLCNALSAVTGLVTVSQLQGLINTCGCSAWSISVSYGPVLKMDLRLNGRVAPRIKDLAANNVNDLSPHVYFSFTLMKMRA